MLNLLHLLSNRLYVIVLLQALENEIISHEPQLLSVTAVGEELVRQGHFGAKSIQDRLDSTLGMWQHLRDLTDYRRKRLEEAVDFHQVISTFPNGFFFFFFSSPKFEFTAFRSVVVVILSLEK